MDLLLKRISVARYYSWDGKMFFEKSLWDMDHPRVFWQESTCSVRVQEGFMLKIVSQLVTKHNLLVVVKPNIISNHIAQFASGSWLERLGYTGTVCIALSQ